MTTALELPTGLVVRQWWPLLLLLGPVLAAGTFAETLLPGRLRDLMSAESAANDGFAFPFVMLPILLLTQPATPYLAAEYLVGVWLWEIITGCVICALIGWVSGTILKWADRKGYVENTSLVGYSIVLALSVLGAGRCLGINEVLGSFVAGVTFASALDARDRIAELQIQETADLLLGNLFFLAFGASIPWDSWDNVGFGAGQMIGVAFAVLGLKRLPVLLAVYKIMPGGLHTVAEAAHFGWFGPVGVAAFFYALEVIESVGGDTGERCYVLLTWLIFASVIIHGVSGVPFTKLLSPGMDLSEEHAREAAAKAAAEAAAAAAGHGVEKEPAASGESISGEIAVQMHIAAAGAGAAVAAGAAAGAAAAAAARSEVSKAAGGLEARLRQLWVALDCVEPADAQGLRAAAAGGSSRYALHGSASLRPGGGTSRTPFAARRYDQLVASSVPLPAAAAAGGGGAVGNGAVHRSRSHPHGAGAPAAEAQGGGDAEAPPPPPTGGEAELVPGRV
ncbi:hypothetical protein HXX76_010315 [Chlamydomonas incerta]|uniref:Cation/H+ exchanger transmembrane domain-containing protein n=1 Tax=Chlamydomonas incerta TaxID=51695 RepID=A0A835SQZ9_CHLIN|nr:hypothetical protein HXX76_010315 [Chlamydomonas incerta]|eukprot:KAG2430216.1 hypothetical protein HXX76_010315 [Chlamydomonas incerta]